MVAVILWKFKYTENHAVLKDYSEGYSFWLAVGAVAATGIAAILSLISAVAHKNKG